MRDSSPPLATWEVHHHHLLHEINLSPSAAAWVIHFHHLLHERFITTTCSMREIHNHHLLYESDSSPPLAAWEYFNTISCCMRVIHCHHLLYESTVKPAFSGPSNEGTPILGHFFPGMDRFSILNALWSGDTCPMQTGKSQTFPSITWHEGTVCKLWIPNQYRFLLT